MSSFTKALPKIWELTTLGEAYKVIGGGTPSTDAPDCWGGDTPWITSADIEGVRQINVRKYVTEKGIKESATNKVPPKTLLVVTRVGLGKIAIAETSICFSQDLQGLIQDPKLICPEYTLYLLSYELQFLKFDGRGTTISGITKKQLKDLAFPFSPLPEQHRIVAKIEELFSELDKGIENLKTARAQLKVYRQALLKHAFEGKLTAQWRAENKDKLETADALLKRIQTERGQRYQQQLANWEAAGKHGSKPKAPKSLSPLTVEELTELPEGWGHIQIGNLLDVVSGGTPKEIEDTKGTGIPYYRVSDMNRIGNEVSMNSSATYLSEKEAADIGLNMYPVGTIIFPKRGGAIATNKKRRLAHKSCFDLNLMGLTNLPDSVSADYLWLWMLALDLASISDGSNVPQINNRNIEPIAFPICLPAEQALIVELTELRLSVCDQLDQTITTSLQQAEALRQSILKKAFSGQLVPQDPHDEPASALLARIKAEKSAHSNSKKVHA